MTSVLRASATPCVATVAVVVASASGAAGAADTVPPARIGCTPPRYPPELIHRSLEGSVTLSFRVRESGTVEPASQIVVRACDSAFV
jgi:outer membrane biosynthesis protein TonB